MVLVIGSQKSASYYLTLNLSQILANCSKAKAGAVVPAKPGSGSGKTIRKEI